MVSGDTDYIKVVETLHNIGKTVVIAHFKHQSIVKYEGIIDANIVLYENILTNAFNHRNNSESGTKSKENNIQEQSEQEN